MQKIGSKTTKKISTQFLKELKAGYEMSGGVCDYYDLSWSDCPSGTRDAGVLVLRNYADKSIGVGTADGAANEIWTMQTSGAVDKKALFWGKVKNKNARWNNVIADFAQSPQYEEGKGTIVPFPDVYNLEQIRNKVQVLLEQPNPPIAELNYYHDVRKCGIGFHGDAERTLVAGLRLGKATNQMPLFFQAYYRKHPIGPMSRIVLEHGDLYIMSEVAVGADWMSSSYVTWRHAAGMDGCKYVTLKSGKRKRDA